MFIKRLSNSVSVCKNVLVPIYMDYQATTPTDQRVVSKMLPYFNTYFGNPHSKTHRYGWDAEKAVEYARNQVANLIKANPKEIIWTSGATESNNMAIKGASLFSENNNKNKNHVISVQTEHKCVLDSCRYLEQRGFNVTYLPVNSKGLVSVDDIRNSITDKTILVSVMMVNNEIGVIQPIKDIGALCRSKNVLFHTDAAQAFGKIHINVNEMNIDLMSISGHKIYGPKGIGALYIRRRPKVRIQPLISGGGQERGLRSGTLPTPLIVGLGEAAEIASEDFVKDHIHIKMLSEIFIEKIKNIKHVIINGCMENRYRGNINISFSFVEGESLLMGMKDVALSSGSACTSSSLEPSYVLRALGLDDETSHSSIRFGIGRFTTIEDIDFTVDLLEKQVGRLRNLSPLWEMHNEGIDIKSIKWKTDH